MSKESIANSVENLNSVGKSTSRGNLFSQISNFEDTIDRLKMMDYHKTFCNQQFLPLHKHYFAAPARNQNEQFHYFTSLFAWLCRSIGRAFQAPGQFDDPNASSALVANELKKLGIPFDYGPAKLKQGHGDGVMYALQALVEHVFNERKLAFKKPVQKLDDYPEEAQVDADAEVTTETVEEEIEANNEEDDAFLDALNARKSTQVASEITTAKVDPAEWQLEVERVAASLKIQLPNNNKDWRIHLQQMDKYQTTINSIMSKTQGQLQKIGYDIQEDLQQISSREKYINSQFEPMTDKYRQIQEKSSDLKQKYNSASSTLTHLTNELSRVSEELDTVKSRIDELGNGMTDSKQLSSIKQALGKLKVHKLTQAEVMQMDIRTGVIEHSLLHAKMLTKGPLAANAPFIYQ